MEAVSENRRRGRPRVFDDTFLEAFTRLFPEVKTHRGKQNLAYRSIAIQTLLVPDADRKDFSWLGDFEAMKAGDSSWKPGILAELGRVRDADLMREMALVICERKPATQEAVAMIRRWRTGKDRPTNVIELTNKIITAINTYLIWHPTTTWEQVQVALDNAGHYVGMAEQDAEPTPVHQAAREHA